MKVGEKMARRNIQVGDNLGGKTLEFEFDTLTYSQLQTIIGDPNTTGEYDILKVDDYNRIYAVAYPVSASYGASDSACSIMLTYSGLTEPINICTITQDANNGEGGTLIDMKKIVLPSYIGEVTSLTDNTLVLNKIYFDDTESTKIYSICEDLSLEETPTKNQIEATYDDYLGRKIIIYRSNVTIGTATNIHTMSYRLPPSWYDDNTIMLSATYKLGNIGSKIGGNCVKTFVGVSVVALQTRYIARADFSFDDKLETGTNVTFEMVLMRTDV